MTKIYCRSQFIIDTVKSKLPTESEPKISSPAVAGALTSEPTDIATPDANDSSKTPADPQTWWKFAVKAAYLKATMLANCLEINKPKRLIFDFAEPVLAMCLKIIRNRQYF